MSAIDGHILLGLINYVKIMEAFHIKLFVSLYNILIIQCYVKAKPKLVKKI